MTKEQLAALGLTEEQVEKTWKLFDGNYVPKDRFNEVNGKLKAAEAGLAAANGQLDAQKGEKGDTTALMAQIATLQADLIAKDTAHADELKQIKLDAAIEKALFDAKAKNPKAARALLDVEEAEIGNDGTVKGLDEKIKALMASEDSKFLFDTDDGKGKVKLKGMEPGEKKDGLPDSDADSYKAQLDDARKAGNTLEAIMIKQAAAADGIILV